MKKVLTILLALLMAALLAACGSASSSAPPSAAETTAAAVSPATAPSPSSAQPIKLAVLAGPTGMSVIKMFDDPAYDISLFTSPDQITPKIINGEVDAAAVPSNLAAVLYNKMKGGIKAVSVNTMGVLYILENGDTVNSIADLAGKTLYATGQGATPEYVLNKLLQANGLNNVNVQYMGAHADLANAMAAGTVKLALLPEPFVSTVLAKNSSVKVKLDINAEWQKIYGSGAAMPMGVTVVSGKLAQNKAAMDKLIADWSASAAYVVSDPAGASAAIAEKSIVPSAAIAAAAIPRCGIAFITGENSKSILADYLDVMLAANPASIGGALPPDDFYYMP